MVAFLVVVFFIFVYLHWLYPKVLKQSNIYKIPEKLGPWPDLKLFIAVRSKDNQYAGFAGSLSHLMKMKKVVLKMMVLPASSAPNFFENFKDICVDSDSEFGLLVDIKDDLGVFDKTAKRLYIQTRIVNNFGEVVDACIDEDNFSLNCENDFWINYAQNYISRIKLVRDKDNKITELRLNR